MIDKKQIEEFRKRNCYCSDINEPGICSKCGQDTPPKNDKCIHCELINDLLECTQKTGSEVKGR